MQACSKSGSLCADCGFCQAACCQAPDKCCTKQHSDAGISSASITSSRREHHCTFRNCRRETARWNHGACEHAQRAIPFALTVVFAKLRAVKHRTNTAQNSIAMPASHLHPHHVFSARTPLHLSQLSQRNGPLESRCMQACSKSGSLCADCGLCQAACCQAPDKYCTKQHSDAGISSASPSRLLGANTTAPFATVAAKRPAGITVHASMLKERFLMR